MIQSPFAFRPAAALLAGLLAAAPALADPLPSWNGGAAKARLIGFVEATTTPGSPDYLPPEARIAVFDNDGTLWAEKPFYSQVFFAMDTVAALAREDPGIAATEALKAAARGDLAGVLAHGEEGLVEVVLASHSGLSVEAFGERARAWLDTARHPVTGRPFDAMVYQPMLELLRYLRDEGYATWIVSGGGVDFLRAFADETYGIPPHQVIGSAGRTAYVMVDGTPQIRKEAEVAFIDDKAGKPVAIDRQIGLRPVLAVGNSDGDFEMLEWTTAGEGPRLGVLLRHTDAAREWAYDRDSPVGRLDRGLDEADARGWLLIDMGADWARVFPAAD